MDSGVELVPADGTKDVAEMVHAVPSYPTISEVWLRLLESYVL